MSKIFIENIVEKLKLINPGALQLIPLHEPQFNGKEWEYVKECIDTGWVSSSGEFVMHLESKLVDFIKAKYAIAVNNGTAALHIALVLSEVKAEDEVLIPTLTFIATANAVSYCGAIPHLVDSEEETLGIDPYKLSEYLHQISELRDGECYNMATGRRIKALVPVHTFGHPVQIEKIIKVCQQFNLTLVEDAAESLGSYYKGQHTGTWGKSSALSFNGNKIITTGGGGAILTNDETLAKLAKHLTTTAKMPHKWEYRHDHVGYNYRLPNINAALGCAQMEQLPFFLKNKRKLANRYEDIFKNVEGIRFFSEPHEAKSNYWLNVLLIDKKNELLRDRLLESLNQNKLLVRPAWIPMHNLKMFEKVPKMNLSTAESIVKRLINIPSSSNLGEAL